MSFSFDTKSDGVIEKLHARGVSVPVLLGLICVVAIALVLMGQNLWTMVSGDGSGSNSAIEITKEGSSSVGTSESSGISGEDSSETGDSASSGDFTHASEGPGRVSDEICVDVAGEVKNPGLYKLDKGSRLDDAVAAAGGFTKKAERTSVNLAQPLEDGMQVIVLKKEAGSSASYGSGQGSASSAGASSSGTSVSSGSASGKVNINTASADQLTALPGVGEATAQKIVADRKANGSFKKPEDIKRVSGIGDKKFEAMSELICV